MVRALLKHSGNIMLKNSHTLQFQELFIFLNVLLKVGHFSLLNLTNKQKMILVLNKGYCYIKRKSWFCFPFSDDVSLDFISGNIRTLGKIKLTFSLGI